MIRMIKMEEDEIGSSCRTQGVMRNGYSIWVGKPEGRRLVWNTLA
jgi:hypothetical protein